MAAVAPPYQIRPMTVADIPQVTEIERQSFPTMWPQTAYKRELEHNLAVIEQADWIIDLGPEGGKNGGEIVFTGKPEQLVRASGSLTGEYLRRYQAAWE